MEKSKPSYITGANVKCYSCFGKQFFKRLNIKLPCDPQIGNNPKRPSSHDQKNKVWYICTINYHSATKRNRVLNYITAWMNLEDSVSESSQAPKPNYRTIYTICPKQTNSQGQKIDEWFPGAGGRGQRGMAAPGHRVSFWSTELLWN